MTDKENIRLRLKAKSIDEITEDVMELTSLLIEQHAYMSIAKRSFIKEGLDASAEYTEGKMQRIESKLKSIHGKNFEI